MPDQKQTSALTPTFAAISLLTAYEARGPRGGVMLHVEGNKVKPDIAPSAPSQG